MRNEWDGPLYSASFETGAAGEDGIIGEYVSIVEGLTDSGRRLWNGCSKREFDFGYDSGETPNDFHSRLSAASVELIAKLGGSISITIYPFWNKSTESGVETN